MPGCAGLLVQDAVGTVPAAVGSCVHETRGWGREREGEMIKKISNQQRYRGGSPNNSE